MKKHVLFPAGILAVFLMISTAMTAWAAEWQGPNGSTADENEILQEEAEPMILYPAVHPDESCNNYAGKHAEPIFGVQADESRKGKIAFSFDSAYINTCCIPILDILDRYQIKSTFFMTGEWVDENPELVKEIVRRGHELGNHSVSHPSFNKLSKEQIVQQVTQTHDKIKALTDFDACLFRFPYGDYNNASMDALKELGYYCIQWTVDTQDWRNDSPEAILNRVYKSANVKEGSIVLMHNGAIYTPQVLETIIQYVQGKGLTVVPVSELIYTRDYHMNVMGTQIPLK